MPVPIEDDGDGDEHKRDAAQEGAGPVHLQRVEHVGREEGEDGPRDGAEEGVCRDCGGGAGEKRHVSMYRCGYFWRERSTGWGTYNMR